MMEENEGEEVMAGWSDIWDEREMGSASPALCLL